ncbi:MAG: hypothetical protein EOO22_17865 [Comamonadaceae bacterium]|nr:MAG: hypothetical protein EOO22_17865 [Comamonadaceae bacterium]
MPAAMFTHVPTLVRAAAAAATLLLAGCASLPMPDTAKPQLAPGTPPASAIYIGNSFFYFNNGIVSHMAPLIAAGTPGFRHRQSMVTISGSGFDWHDVESYFRPNAIGKYSFTADNKVVFNQIERLFDVAIIMDCSQCPVHPQLKPVFHDYAKKHADTMRKHGARPVFFMSWAYKDAPEMTAQLEAEYTAAGRANGAMVIPAGLAFARSVAQRPELDLYHADKRHPSPAGSYLSALTTYATLFGRSPVGFSYTGGLSADVARHLQTVAWDTVQAYRQP